MGLKATGSYLSRALSYRGADFALAPVPIDLVFRSSPASFYACLEVVVPDKFCRGGMTSSECVV